MNWEAAHRQLGSRSENFCRTVIYLTLGRDVSQDDPYDPIRVKNERTDERGDV
jgi:hypothetical protein